MTYVTVLVCQLFNITQRRSEGGLFTRYTLTNPTYWLACAAGVTIMLVIVYVPVGADDVRHRRAEPRRLGVRPARGGDLRRDPRGRPGRAQGPGGGEDAHSCRGNGRLRL